MTRHDAGLVAVTRVRGARERDSRLGLRQAVAEQRAAEERVAVLRDRLAGMAAPDDGSVASYVVHHELTRSVTEAISAARDEVRAAAALAASAHAHWQRDKSRLSAVEMLLERRAAGRREEQRRREARDLDEVVGQQWLRARNRVGGA